MGERIPTAFGEAYGDRNLVSLKIAGSADSLSFWIGLKPATIESTVSVERPVSSKVAQHIANLVDDFFGAGVLVNHHG